MRLLHPTTIKILANHPEFPKTHLAHAWSEVFKFLAQSKSHPKMFITNKKHLGQYLVYLYNHATKAGCKLDKNKVFNLGENVVNGFMDYYVDDTTDYFMNEFDDNYLFSDACSLYFKGTNIFPDIFGDQWRKYVPVESLTEINRQINKTLNKKI